jgi:hypothetical protein
MRPLQQSHRLESLCEQARQSQWSVDTDIDWSLEVPFSSSLPDDSFSSRGALNDSPFAGSRRPLWDAFRWELQSWLACQFLHGERAALTASARLAESLPIAAARQCAAAQAIDEARHTAAFSRYIREQVRAPYSVKAAIDAPLRQAVERGSWDMTMLATQVILEPLAVAAFRIANTSLHDPLIRQIVGLVARDEPRHVSFGIVVLKEVYGELTAVELAEREEFIMEVVAQMSECFLLPEVWKRLGIRDADGIRFAATHPMMVTYRQTLFTRIIASLTRIGVMTPRVRDRFATLNLIGPGGARAGLTLE